MATPRMFTTPTNNVVSTQVYAPNNAGFTHPSKSQFTYFESAGTRTTFGMSCAELNKLMSEFTKNFIAEVDRQFNVNDGEISALLAKLRLTQETLHSQESDLKNQQSYSSNESIAQSVLNTGHIPIMLSAIAPAAGFAVSARSVDARDVQKYFSSFPTGRAQGREYCVKQDMMRTIAELREAVVELRYRTDPTKPLFILCNRLTIELDTKVIAVNQKSLPNEYEQFDLCHTFIERVGDLTCELNHKNAKTKNLINSIIDLLRPYFGDKNNLSEFFITSFRAGIRPNNVQQDLSNKLYELLIPYVKKEIGLGNDTDAEEISLTEKQDKMLQDILPLIAYLNSPNNPFARNGLFGKEVTNDFHKKALDAYKAHESLEITMPVNFTYHAKQKKDSVEFDEDQIEQLLEGKKIEKQQQSGFSMFNRLLGSSSQSSERRQQLALPAPSQYQRVLLIEYTPTNDNNNNNSNR